VTVAIRSDDGGLLRYSKQERVCGHIVAGKPAGQAYALSGYTSKSPDPDPSNQVGIPKIARRIEQVRAQATKRNEISVDLILRELDLVRRSLASGQISAAVAVSLGRAKVAGPDHRQGRAGAAQAEPDADRGSRLALFSRRERFLRVTAGPSAPAGRLPQRRARCPALPYPQRSCRAAR
jgi:hypothetical protein